MSWAPFELGLQNELEVEKRRFASDWLFRWHNLHIQGKAVEVENFARGRISYSGVPLNSQMQSVFWQAVTRYLLNFVHQTFDRWAKEAASYDVTTRRHSLAHTEAVLRGFAGATISKAVETDHRVRGAGFPERVQPYSAAREQQRLVEEITRVAAAHRMLLEAQSTPQPAPVTSTRQRLEELFNSNRGLLTGLGLAVATLGLAVAIMKLFL